MRKVNLGINIVLIIAIAVLFVFQFTSLGDKAAQKEKDQVAENSKVPEIEGSLRVAYVNIDSLLDGYYMYQDKRDEFVEEQSNSQAELQSRSQELEARVEDLKEKMSKGLITRAKARMMQQDLGQKEQELYQMRNQMSSELSEKEQVIYRQVLQSVMEYLDDYANQNNFHFVLSYSFGGPILYKDKRFNVTQSVLKGLNEQYNENQKNK